MKRNNALHGFLNPETMWPCLNSLYEPTIHTGRMACLCCGWILATMNSLQQSQEAGSEWTCVRKVEGASLTVSASYSAKQDWRAWLKMRNLFHHPFTPSFIQPACLALRVLLSHCWVGREPELRVPRRLWAEPGKAAATWRGEMKTSSKAKGTKWGTTRRTRQSRHTIASDAVWWEMREEHEHMVWRKLEEESQNVRRGCKEPPECADTTGKPSCTPECAGNGRKQTGGSGESPRRWEIEQKTDYSKFGSNDEEKTGLRVSAVWPGRALLLGKWGGLPSPQKTRRGGERQQLPARTETSEGREAAWVEKEPQTPEADRQNAVSPFRNIELGHEEKRGPHTGFSTDAPPYAMLSGSSQVQTDVWCLLPLSGNVQNKQICRD